MGYPFKVTKATLAVVKALLTREKELYAQKIAKTIGRSSGSVVPILTRLENCGWVVSEWEQNEAARGPRRRFYRLHGNHVGEAKNLVKERSESAQ